MLGKACISFGGAAVTLFVAYAGVAAATEGNPWYLVALWIGFVVAGVLFLLTGAAYLYLLAKRRLNPLDILDIRCAYLTRAKEIQVTLWICDYSYPLEFKVVSCSVQFEEQIVYVDRVVLDGPYIGNTVCMGGRKRMVEFLKKDVAVANPAKCQITIKMKPLGIWATKQKTKGIDVQVI